MYVLRMYELKDAKMYKLAPWKILR